MSFPDNTTPPRSPLEDGIAQRRLRLGDAWVNQSFGKSDAFNAEFQTFMTEYAWGGVWARGSVGNVTPAVRRIMVLCHTLAAARWEEYELHLKAALDARDESRITPQELREVLIQAAVYSSVPNANTAMKIARALLAERPALKDTVAPALHVVRDGQWDGDKPKDPSQPVLVLSHALGWSHRMWDGVVERLKDTHAILRYDARGHGQSAKPGEPYTMIDMVDDAAALILRAVFAQPGARPVRFVGLSMGGMVAQGLAARHPSLVGSIVIANSTSHYPDQAVWAQRIDAVNTQGLQGAADVSMQRWFSPAFNADVARSGPLRDRFLANDPAAYVKACAAVGGIDFRASNTQIACPTCVIAGVHDVATQPIESERIAAAVPGAVLKTIDAAHMSAVEYPDAFVALLREFWA